MDSPDKKLTSLKEFVDEHERIITVIGVFVALGLFWRSVPVTKIGSYVSFLCFLITVPLFFEVWNKVDIRTSSWSLVIFINLFSGIMIQSAWYVLVGFPNQRHILISNGLFWLSFIPTWLWLRKHVNKYIAKKIEKGKKSLRNIEETQKYLETNEFPGVSTYMKKWYYPEMWRDRLILGYGSLMFYVPKFVLFLILFIGFSIFFEYVTPVINVYFYSVDQEYDPDLAPEKLVPPPQLGK